MTYNRVRALKLSPVFLALGFAGASSAAAEGGHPARPRDDTAAFRAAVTLRGVRNHQRALQTIADENGGTRAAGTPGFDRSADYVERKLKRAGYQVVRQAFEFAFFQELSPPLLEQLSPQAVTYAPNDPAGFFGLTYSPSGDVTGRVQNVDLVLPPAAAANTSTSGCEPSDFAGFAAGNVALLQRGTCSFLQKASNAEAAGAVGAILFNEGQPGRTDAFPATLGEPSVGIPLMFVSFAIGAELAGLPAADVHLVANTVSETRITENVLADSGFGNPEQTIVVGGHLDSVPEGAGMNDNGSGSAVILEIAEQLARLTRRHSHSAPPSRVRFAFWGAEELGLLGSEHYVSTLTPEQLGEIALNLNFDMLGSPNFVRFVYDGDGSDTPLIGPAGSDQIERVFVEHFAAAGLAVAPTAFDGRSDYGPFIAQGIPAGGLFSGAEELKTEEEAAIYGGTAGLALDPCYHQACDDIDNNSDVVLDQFADAAAHAVLAFASKAQPIDVAPEPASIIAPSFAANLPLAGGAVPASVFEYRGPQLQK